VFGATLLTVTLNGFARLVNVPSSLTRSTVTAYAPLFANVCARVLPELTVEVLPSPQWMTH